MESESQPSAPQRVSETLATDGARSGRPERGDEIDRYVVLGHLGEGGMGVVLRAYDPKLQREVALKLIKSRATDDAANSAHARLLREAQTMAQLSHPNVVPVFDVGSVGHNLFVAMELVDGDNLRGWLRAESRDLPAIIDAFVQAGEGLLAAHRAGLVHRDLKPGNLLVGNDGRVRVVDFGLARAVGADTSLGVHDADADSMLSPADHLTAPLTEAGSVVGTPAYMAPEQHRGLPTDARTDQYSFCLTLYEAIYGARPFTALDSKQLARDKAAGPPSMAARAALPRRVVAVLTRGLEPDPGARWPSMAEVVEQLGPQGGRSKLGVGVAGATIVAGVAAWSAGLLDRTVDCESARAEFGDSWTPAVQAHLQEAFMHTEARHAADAWTRTSDATDRYVARWGDAREQSCVQTRVLNEQPEDKRQQRVACLHQARDRLAAVLAELHDPQLVGMARAAQAIDDLRDPSRCLDAANTDPLNVPATLVRAEATAALGGEVGKASEALLDVDAPRLQVRVDMVRAVASAHAGDIAGGARALALAYAAAGSIEFHEAAADIALALTALHHDRADGDAAKDWAEHAAMMVQRGDLGPRRAARAQAARASALSLLGAHERAQDCLESATEKARHELGEAHPDTAELMLIAARANAAAGKRERARGAFETAIAQLRLAHGDSSPQVAKASVSQAQLVLTVATAPQVANELEDALDALRGTLGPRDLTVTATVIALARTHTAAGNHDDALRLLRNAVAIRTRELSGSDPRRAEAQVALAVGLKAAGNVEESRALAVEALPTLTAHYAAAHPSIVSAQALTVATP